MTVTLNLKLNKYKSYPLPLHMTIASATGICTTFPAEDKYLDTRLKISPVSVRIKIKQSRQEFS